MVEVRKHIRSFSAKVHKDLRIAGARLPHVRILAEATSKPSCVSEKLQCLRTKP